MAVFVSVAGQCVQAANHRPWQEIEKRSAVTGDAGWGVCHSAGGKRWSKEGGQNQTIFSFILVCFCSKFTHLFREH